MNKTEPLDRPLPSFPSTNSEQHSQIDQVPEDDDDDDFGSVDGYTEDASFLQPWQQQQQQRSAHRRRGRSGTSGRRHPSAYAVTMAASALLLAFDLSWTVTIAPRMAVFEDIICHKHYGVPYHQPLDGDCKIETVQSELVFVNNWWLTLDAIPGIFAAIPYGALADRIGRDKSLMFALVGCILSDGWVSLVCLMPNTFSIRAIWMSGLFQFVGGGGALVASMLHTMIGDVCSPEERTTAFSKAHAATLISELVSIPLASVLMTVSPWIPIFMALGVMALMMLTVLCLSLAFVPPRPKAHMDRGSTSLTSSTLSFRGPVRWLDRYIGRLIKATNWITRDIACMLVAFFCCQLGRHYSSILLQYTTIRFDWDYAKASYLLVLRAAGNLLVLFTALPYLSWLFTKRGRQRMSQNQSDKRITILSGGCLVLGSLLIFLSRAPAVAVLGQASIALGSAFTVTARSMLTEMAGPQNISLSFTSVTTVTYLGVIVGGPLLAALFQQGMSLGESWVGLPFAAVAVFFGISTLMVAVARFRSLDL